MTLTAKEKIAKAKIQIQYSNSFFAYLSFFLKFREDVDNELSKSSLGMGVSIDGTCIYKKEFVEKITQGDNTAQLEGVLCFTEDTIIGGKEFKLIKNIKVGDLVINQFGNLENVKRKFERKINEEIYNLNATNLLPIRTTKEHPFLVKKYSLKNSVKRENRSLKEQFKNVKSEWVNVKDIKINDLIAVPKIKGNFNKEKISLKKFYPQLIQRQTHVIDSFILNEETSWLFGLYVADGSSSGSGLRFNLNDYSKNKYFKRVENILKKYFKVGKTNTFSSKDSRAKCLDTSSRQLSRTFIEFCGKNAKNKKIPSFILYNKNKKILQSFLEGYACGDGFYYKKMKHLQVATVSKVLAQQIQLAYLRFGKLVNVYNYKRDGVYHKLRGRELKNLNNYQIIIKDNYKLKHIMNDKNCVWVKVKKINKEKYNGLVYNFETKSHTYTANNIIVHNCHEICHLVFQHLQRLKDRNPDVWNICADVVVNSLLTKNNFKLPNGVLMPNNNNEITLFEKTPYQQIIENCDKKTAEQIYNELKIPTQNQKRYVVVGEGGGNQKKGKGLSKEELNKGRFDVHIEGDGLSSKEKNELMKEWGNRVYGALYVSRMRGDIPKGMERLLGKLHEEKINWRVLLQRYIVNQIPYDYSWAKFSKKSIATGVPMPHTLKEKISIVVGIDVSGSIGQKELTDFLSEILGIAKAFQERIDMKLITHEVDVNSELEIKNGNIEMIKNLKIKGGGGTAHQKLFNHIQEKVRNCKCCVFLTDGYSDLNEIEFGNYNFDKLFVISENGNDSQLKNKRCQIIHLKD